MIEAVKFIPRLVKFGILGLVLVGLNGTITQAQRAEQDDGSIDLLSLSCSTSGRGELVTDNKEDISIDKQIFAPAFYFSKLRYTGESNPFLLTCRHTPSEQPQTLQLVIGVKDYAESRQHEITFKAYLDGQETVSHLLSAGEGKTILLDVTKNSSIALEADCWFDRTNYWCPSLAFIKASILPSPTSSLTDPNSTAFNNTENSDPFNNASQTLEPPLEESSWGNSTVGEEEETTSNSNSSGSNLEDTIEDVNTIIDIFK